MVLFELLDKISNITNGMSNDNILFKLFNIKCNIVYV